MKSSEIEKNILNSIKVERFERKDIEILFLEEIDKSYAELKTILSDMPTILNVSFDERDNYGETGTDGFAISDDMIGICIKPDVDDRGPQFLKIRSLVFHEGYHMRQGFHYGAGSVSALEAAIYEGCATIFERDYANSEPKWGNYAAEGKEKLEQWYDAMRSVTPEQYFEPSGETWKKWAFYDDETGESWRIYKVGTWIVDEVLRINSLSVVDLQDKTAQEILTMSGRSSS